MTDPTVTNDGLLHLLQQIYFDNIDSGNADGAVEALHDNIRWAHTQVWEHDGHDRSAADALHGREEVRQFLAGRISEMQVEGIRHKVEQVVTDGKTGAFRGAVIGPTGDREGFSGWVEIRDGKIADYNIGPVLLGRDS